MILGTFVAFIIYCLGGLSLLYWKGIEINLKQEQYRERFPFR